MPPETQFEDEYHNRYRMNPYIALFGQRGPMLRRIRKAMPHGMLVDIGCGQGWWLREASKYYTTAGADVSRFALERAKQNSPNSDVRLITDMDALPFESSFADVITCWDVIEHVPEPAKYFSEFARIVKPGGVLVLSTPNPNCVSARLKPSTWHGARDATHVSMKTSSRWAELAAKHGFRVKSVTYDWLWDVPYVQGVSGVAGKFVKFVEHGLVQLPSVLAFNAGISSPEPLGENIYIVAVKDAR